MTDSYAGRIAFDVHQATAADGTPCARGEMPVQAGILNPFGTVHAGALIWFADVVATHLLLGDRRPEEGMQGFPLAVSLNAQLLANTRDGLLTAEATFVKRGRRLSVVRTQVHRPDGRAMIDVTTSHVPSE